MRQKLKKWEWALSRRMMRGASMAEYAIVMAAIVLVGWAASRLLGGSISDFIQSVASHF